MILSQVHCDVQGVLSSVSRNARSESKSIGLNISPREVKADQASWFGKGERST